MTSPAEDLKPWRVFVFNTRSGAVIDDFPVGAPPRWDRGINSGGGWTHNVPLGGIRRSRLAGLTDPWRHSVGVAYGSRCLQGGPLVGLRHQDADDTVELTGSGLWGLLASKRRLVNPVWTGNPAAAGANVDYTGLSLHTIAKRLIQLSTAMTNGDLPIVYPDDIAGTATKHYDGFDLAYVGTRLQELTQVDGGPEVEFALEFTSPDQTAVRWRARIGNPRLGQLGYPHSWDYNKAATKIDRIIDGSGQTHDRIERGSGAETDLLTGRATTTVDSSTPLLQDVSGDHTSATEVATLTSWAQAAVTTNARPIETWDVTVRVAGDDGQGHDADSPSLEELEPGDNGRITVVGHKLIPDGTYEVRVLGISSGDTLATAKLDLQPLSGTPVTTDAGVIA